MAGIIVTENSNQNDITFGKWQFPVKLFLEKRAEAMEQMSIAKKIFAQVKSTHAGESYSSMTGMDEFQPSPEAGDYPVTDFRAGPTKVLEDVEWLNSFRLSKKLIEDNNLIEINKRPAAFLAAYYRTQETFFAQMLAAAIHGQTSFTRNGIAFDTTTADNIAAFSKNHKTLITKEAQPNAYKDAFSLTALGRVTTRMQNSLGEKGEILSITPDTILIPNDEELKNEVVAAIGSEKIPGSNNNDINYQYGNWNLLIWPYLNRFLASGEKPWVVFDSKYVEENKCMVWQDRLPLSVDSMYEKNNVNVWYGRSRFTGGFTSFYGLACGGISGGETA